MPAPHLPTVRYHPSEPPRPVATLEALAALGPEWLDHPYSEEERAAWQAAQAAPQAADETPPPRSRR